MTPPLLTLLRAALVAALVAAGLVGAIVAGDRLEARAHDTWIRRAGQETERITDTCLFWLTLYQGQLRGVAALFHSSDSVNEDELFDALDVIEGLEAAIPLEAVAFAQPTDRGWRIVLSTDFQGLLAVDTMPTHPALLEALASALDEPDLVVMGAPFEEEGRQLSLMALAAPNHGVQGVVASVIDLTALLEGLESLLVPEGLHLRLTVERDGPGGRAAETIWGGPSASSAVTQFSYATDSGQVHWEFVWDVLPEHRGGPDTQLARVVEIGTAVVVLLAGAVIALLFRQNLRVQREVRERTAELRRSVRETEAAYRSRSVFLANMSHEIRTPLNAILGFTDILERNLHDPVQQDHLSSIRDSGTALLEVISGILDMARMDTGGLDLAPVATDVQALFGEVAAAYAQQAAMKEVELNTRLDPQLPGVLVVDGPRMRQVVASLLDNAVKFTTEGSVRMQVSARVDGERVDLSISVEDTGVGIPEDELQRIFGAFVQKDQQSINEYGGLGLGLALTRQLVQLMGGEVHVHSAVGQGSTFVVQLPGIPIGPTAAVDEPVAASADATPSTAEDAAAGELTSETRARLPELVGELRRRETAWQTLVATQTIHEVEAFAEQIQQLGSSYSYEPLQRWSERLVRETATFDVEAMGRTLQSYPVLIDEADRLSTGSL